MLARLAQHFVRLGVNLVFHARRHASGFYGLCCPRLGVCGVVGIGHGITTVGASERALWQSVAGFRCENGHQPGALSLISSTGPGSSFAPGGTTAGADAGNGRAFSRAHSVVASASIAKDFRATPAAVETSHLPSGRRATLNLGIAAFGTGSPVARAA